MANMVFLFHIFGLVVLFSCFVMVEPMKERSHYGYAPQRATYGRSQRKSYRPQRTYYKPAPKKTYQTYDPRALDQYEYRPPRKQTVYRPVMRYVAKEVPIIRYEQPKLYEKPKTSIVYKPYKEEEYDPCSDKHEGDYVLSGEFLSVFPYVDSSCYFVKCANYKAFLNPCGIGTRNDEYGDGFCSYLDYDGKCGYAFGSHNKQEETSYGETNIVH